MVKYPHWVQILLYDTTWGRPPYDFRQMSYLRGKLRL